MYEYINYFIRLETVFCGTFSKNSNVDNNKILFEKNIKLFDNTQDLTCFTEK